MLDSLKAWCKHSLTIVWARLLSIGGVALAAVMALSADPATSSAVQGLLGPYGPYWLIGIGVVTELARRRTVTSATDENNQVKS